MQKNLVKNTTLKPDREKTKSVQDTVHVVSSVTTTENTMEQDLQKTPPLNKDGCRLLAATVIQHARKDKDKRFFSSKDYNFWAEIAYGGKPDGIEGEEINYMIDHNIDRSDNKSARGRTPRCI